MEWGAGERGVCNAERRSWLSARRCRRESLVADLPGMRTAVLQTETVVLAR